ncbi:hypothetical protein FXO37_32870 [Capsicum annuum]|nr:hypothetical protein FXO37_32870 [Capsicum annuum]
MLACNTVEPGMPITSGVTICYLDFTTFKDNYEEIYFKLVRAKILYPIERRKNKWSTKWRESDDICHYHNGIKGHAIEKCHVFALIWNTLSKLEKFDWNSCQTIHEAEDG